ncbi:MAG: hypothetical protein WKF31_03035 [Thermoleophilaceae bacterium]
MTGHGGWPLNVFLTPGAGALLRGHLLPARAAPRHAELAAGARGRDARPGAIAVTRSVRAASGIAERLQGGATLAAVDGADRRARRSTPPSTALAGAYDAGLRRLRRRAQVPARLGDRVPAAPRRDGEHVARATLDAAMASGGIYDQVGGGFARYAVDADWLVPHFEKMLYDNALLARAYLHGWQVTGRRACCARSCERDARLGAARDARARGRLLLARSTPTPRARRAASTSGRSSELRDALGAHAEAAIAYFGATRAGQLRGSQHPRAQRARSRERPRRDQAPSLRRARTARLARASTTSA